MGGLALALESVPLAPLVLLAPPAAREKGIGAGVVGMSRLSLGRSLVRGAG